jgi:hypothetical protein
MPQSEAAMLHSPGGSTRKGGTKVILKPDLKMFLYNMPLMHEISYEISKEDLNSQYREKWKMPHHTTCGFHTKLIFNRMR